MKRRKFSLPLLLGSCLILGSLCLVLVGQLRARTGAGESREVVAQMETLLPERTVGVPGTYPYADMPVLEIGGEDYVALLEVPAFGVTLPVTDGWEGRSLSRAPARFWGSAYDNTLVVGGSDDTRQFGFCDKIGHGAMVRLTDMTGARFTYTVCGIDRARHAESEWLMDAEYDLTLFCHDVLAMEYVAVRCVLAGNL